MKFRIHKLLFSILVMIASNASAQRFKPGIVLGLAATDIVGVDPYDDDFHKAGVTVGGLLNTRLSDKNSIQFEILYTQKGSLQPADSTNNFTFLKMSLDYVEVPIMIKRTIKFNVNKKPVDRFYLEIGPSIGRLVRVNINSNGSIFDSGNFRKNEVAINAGVGCILFNNLSFNFRFSNSIIPVVNHPEQINSFFWYSFNKGDNVVLSFTLRYIFSTERKEETNKS